MKTFTLRLTDPEAEALERLAQINGKTKKRTLTGLVAKAYKDTDDTAFILEDEIIALSPVEKFGLYAGKTFNRKIDIGDNVFISEADIIKVLRALDYSINNATDPATIETLTSAKDAFIREYSR